VRCRLSLSRVSEPMQTAVDFYLDHAPQAESAAPDPRREPGKLGLHHAAQCIDYGVEFFAGDVAAKAFGGAHLDFSGAGLAIGRISRRPIRTARAEMLKILETTAIESLGAIDDALYF